MVKVFGMPLPGWQPAYLAVIGGSFLVALLASVIPAMAQLRGQPSRAE